MSIQTSSSDLGGYILNNEFVEEDLDDNMSLTSDGVRQRFFLLCYGRPFGNNPVMFWAQVAPQWCCRAHGSWLMRPT